MAPKKDESKKEWTPGQSERKNFSMTHCLCFPITAIAAALLVNCAPSTDKIPQSRTERQMVGLLEKFDRWDYNGDGRLTIDELDEASQISEHSAEEILRFYDTNGDGAITLREAQAGYERRIQQRS